MMSDVEALKGGAGMKETGDVEFSTEQVEAARRDMESDLRNKSVEGRVSAAEVRGQEKGVRLEQQIADIHEVVFRAGGVFSAIASQLSGLKAGMLGGIDSSDSGNKRMLEDFIERGSSAINALYKLERRSPYAKAGTILRLPNFEGLHNALKRGGKVSLDTIEELRDKLQTNAGLLEVMAHSLQSIREGNIKE